MDSFEITSFSLVSLSKNARMKKAKSNLDTHLNQPGGVAITVHMRTAIFLVQCQATMDSYFALVRPHQHIKADTC